MEQRNGNFARPQSIRRQHVIKGILHMIDSAGGRAITTEAQNDIIENQLRQEVYEYEPRYGHPVQKYDVHRIRKLMVELACESNLKPIRKGEDKVALLFRRQSQALDPAILARCGYERCDANVTVQQQSFQVSKGPAATSAGRTERDASSNITLMPDNIRKMRTCYDERAFLLVLQDIDASRSERNEPHYKYNTRRVRMAALQEICNHSKHMMSGGLDTTRPLDYNALHDIVYRVWSDQKPHQWVKFDSLWREGSDSLKPDQLRRLKLSCAQLDHKEHVSASDTASTVAFERKGLQYASQSVPLPSLRSGDEIVLTTPPQRLRESVGTQSAIVKQHSRSLKRKASADSPPDTLFKSQVIFIDNSENASREARDILTGAKRPSVGSQTLSPSNASREMESIFNAQRTGLLGLIGHLKLTQCSCPLTPQPGHELIPLYKRCWGDDWKRDGDALLMSGKRSVLDDTTALTAAFLFEYVLTGAAPPGDVSPEESQPSHTHSRAIMAEFFCALIPYFASLAQLSRMMYSICPTEDPDSTPFRNAMSGIISKALSLRSRLDNAQMKAVFFWPTRGEIYDSERMQAQSTVEMSTSLTYVVAFTIFPGLMYVDPVVGVVYKAWVVLRVEAKR